MIAITARRDRWRVDRIRRARTRRTRRARTTFGAPCVRRSATVRQPEARIASLRDAGLPTALEREGAERATAAVTRRPSVPI